MSDMTPSEYMGKVEDAVERLRSIADEPETDDLAGFACAVVDAITGELEDSFMAAAVLDQVKFKHLVSDLPEDFWPKPDIQKGGER